MPPSFSAHWLVWPIAIPLATALAAFVVGGRWNARLGMVATLLVTAAVVAVTWQVWNRGPQTYPLGHWPPPLGIALYADGLACAMLLMSGGVGAFVGIYSLAYFVPTHSRHDDARGRGESFWPPWLLLWSAINALFLSADIFNMYVTLELMTLAAVGLVALDGSRAGVAAALRYLLAALAGSMMYLAGVALLYGAYGTLDIATLSREATASRATEAALLLVMLGLMFKSALFPFHFWLAPVHAAAPAPASALLSGLVVKGAFYILLRVWFDLFPHEVTRLVSMLPAALGAAAIVWGSVQALAAQRLKMLVAYSTVAQVGYLFLVFGLARWDGESAEAAWNAGILFALAHALAKGALFLAAGTILYVAGHDRIRDLGAVSRQLPVTFFAIGLAAVSLMGLPPTGAFVAKWMMLTAALANGQTWLAGVIVVGGLLAAAYLFRVLAAAFTGPGSDQPSSMPGRASRVLEYTTLALALVSLLLGLVASPLTDLSAIGSPWQPVAAQEPAP